MPDSLLLSPQLYRNMRIGSLFQQLSEQSYATLNQWLRRRDINRYHKVLFFIDQLGEWARHQYLVDYLLMANASVLTVLTLPYVNRRMWCEVSSDYRHAHYISLLKNKKEYQFHEGCTCNAKLGVFDERVSKKSLIAYEHFARDSRSFSLQLAYNGENGKKQIEELEIILNIRNETNRMAHSGHNYNRTYPFETIFV